MDYPLQGREGMDFPCGLAGTESSCNVGDMSSSPGLVRSPREVKGYQLQCSGLENSMDCIVHGVTKSRTATFTFTFPSLSKAIQRSMLMT